ncbi:MAG: Gldg family protein [Clostridia bacterium]|nr:Gldg family protein [Clostridia bacterium]
MWKIKLPARFGKYWWRTALTILIVVAVVAGNVALTAYASTHNLFIDTTSEGRYTVRPQMIEFLKNADMKDDVDIIFCATPDVLLANYNSSLVYVMALELQEQVKNVHVQCVDLSRHPEALDMYKRTSASSLSWSDVIVSSGTEFRVYTTDSFFTVDQNTGAIVGFNGERKMCEAILSMTAKSLPLACFTVGNGETLPSQDDEETCYLYERIRDAGFRIMAIDLETEDIPDSCTLLVINGPTSDFSSGRLEDIDYVSPITKIDAFLDRFGSVFYFRDASAGELPNLEEFLSEWGITFAVDDGNGNTVHGTTLRDTSAALSGDPARISGTYGTSSVYEDITALSSPPKTIFENCSPISILWDSGFSSINNNGRTVTSLFTTTEKAYAVNADGDTVAGGSYSLMTLTSESRIVNNDVFTSTLFVCGTTAYHAAEYMADNVYANGEILQSTVRGAARTVVSVSDELPFKFYEDAAFTESYDEGENSIYKEDEEGNVIWVEDEDGYSRKVVLRVIRPIEEWEKSAWLIALTAIPAVLFALSGAFVVLRRRAR